MASTVAELAMPEAPTTSSVVSRSFHVLTFDVCHATWTLTNRAGLAIQANFVGSNLTFLPGPVVP